MLEEFVSKIISIARPTTVEVGRRPYSTVPIEGVRDPAPTRLLVNTLTGLRDYVKSSIDESFLGGLCAIHIAEHNHVEIISGLTGQFLQRYGYILAVPLVRDMDQFFNKMHSLEKFIITLQSQFVETPALLDLLKVTGNIKEEVVRTHADDGISQEVTVKQGVSRVESVTLPRIIDLSPFRTFREVEQPSSKYIFRMNMGSSDNGGTHGPYVALYDADGEQWKLDAIKNIKSWVEMEIPAVSIIA